MIIAPPNPATAAIVEAANDEIMTKIIREISIIDSRLFMKMPGMSKRL
jgi:hypothetical protein